MLCIILWTSDFLSCFALVHLAGGGRLSSAPIVAAIPPPAVVVAPPVVSAGGAPGAPLQLTESQRRLVEEDVDHSIASQENMQISGTQARHLLMQKLMRPNEVEAVTGRSCLWTD